MKNSICSLGWFPELHFLSEMLSLLSSLSLPSLSPWCVSMTPSCVVQVTLEGRDAVLRDLGRLGGGSGWTSRGPTKPSARSCFRARASQVQTQAGSNISTSETLRRRTWGCWWTGSSTWADNAHLKPKKAVISMWPAGQGCSCHSAPLLWHHTQLWDLQHGEDMGLLERVRGGLQRCSKCIEIGGGSSSFNENL